MSNVLVKLGKYNDQVMCRSLTVDFIWCILSVLITAMAATYIGSVPLTVGNESAITLATGIFQSLIYIQALTLVVLALSLASETISKYRTLIATLAPIAVYIVIRIVTDPEPVAPLYTYGAMITFCGITFYKLKAIAESIWLVMSVERGVRVPVQKG